MNEIFNFRRFGQMLAVDSNRIVRNYGLSFLLISFSELIVFAVASIVAYVTNETMAYLDSGTRNGICAMSAIILILTMPQKCYGSITDKSKGSAYLAIPASSLEKFISMILLMALLMPVLFTSVSWCVDSALCHLFPQYLTDIVTDNSAAVAYTWSDMIKTIVMGMPYWLLGALWFKRGKGGKSLLCLMAVVLVLCILTFLIFDNTETIENAINDLSGLDLNMVENIICIMFEAVMLVLIYLRIRKIQH